MPSPELALAQRHDAAGRYDDAINELARGTAKGDLPCMRQLGKRLLTGENAPLLAADGASFLLEAANKGDAEAAARTAALTALGLYRAQSWTDALRWLTVAAERGLQTAQEQLTALATDAALANEPTRAAAAARLATGFPRQPLATPRLRNRPRSMADQSRRPGPERRSASPDVRGLYQRVSLPLDHRPGARTTRSRARL